MRKVLFIFGQLTDQDCDWLISVGSKKLLAEGEVLIQEGKPIDEIYIVLDGTLAVTVGPRGERQIAQLGSGEIVGEMSFIDARPPSASVKALKGCVVFAIPRSAIAAKLEEDAALAARFYRAISIFLSSRLRAAVSHMGYGEMDELDEDLDAEDELDANVLDTVSLAGDRFHRMLVRLMGA